jgi:hypothetical protein
MSFSSLGQSIVGINSTVSPAWLVVTGRSDRGGAVEQLPEQAQPEGSEGMLCSDTGDAMKKAPCFPSLKTL